MNTDLPKKSFRGGLMDKKLCNVQKSLYLYFKNQNRENINYNYYVP